MAIDWAETELLDLVPISQSQHPTCCCGAVGKPAAQWKPNCSAQTQRVKLDAGDGQQVCLGKVEGQLWKGTQSDNVLFFFFFWLAHELAAKETYRLIH